MVTKFPHYFKSSSPPDYSVRILFFTTKFFAIIIIAPVFSSQPLAPVLQITSNFI